MKKRILFICLGNICRSPSAEAIMKHYVKERGQEDQFYIDSAGISGYHSGDPADKRMQSHAIRRGYDLTSLSRKFYPDADFENFDMIIGMDDQNIRDLQRMATSGEERNSHSLQIPNILISVFLIETVFLILITVEMPGSN